MTLMLAGAYETITNDKGRTPAQEAKRWGYSKLLNLLDRESILQVMQWRKKKLNFSLVLLIMLTLRLMRQKKMMTEKWCHLVGFWNY